MGYPEFVGKIVSVGHNAMIRIATEYDAEQILRIYAPTISGITSFEMTVPTVDVMRKRISTTLAEYPWLVDDLRGHVRGFVYGTQHRARQAYQWTVEVSVYVDQGFHRQGIGRGLYSRLFDVLKRQGFYIAYAGITLPNMASQQLHESLGFAQFAVFRGVGFKNGDWRDVGYWALELRTKTSTEPRPPVAFAKWREQNEL